MYVVSVTVFVRPEMLQKFIALVLDNATNSRREPGNIRFDVSQAEEDPNRFLLYEVYHTKADFVRHQETAHYLRFKEGSVEMMAQPRVGVRHVPLFFGDAKV